jgi:hypothetical protein
MIRKSNLQYLKHFFVVICITPLLAACGEDEPSPTPETSQSTGTVSFDIENSLGSGVGTTTSPAVVGIGDTLAMEISQKSSYTDAKTNQVFTCEPKAEIQIYAISDTIYANNIEDLTNVNSPQTSTSVINGECDTYHINQAFKIGTQEVDINLSYQAYKYTNSNGETVEMPYIKLNRAQSGMASSEKSRASGEAVAVTPTVTLRPISKSRTVSITETHEFEVTTRFSVALESVNTKSKNEQTLNFEVKYIAIVDEVTEYPDATNSLAYEFNLNNQAVSGTTFSLDKVSNFYVNQTSTYTAYNITSTTSPRAWVKLTAITDTIEVASVDEITKTKQVEGKEFAMTGENPKVYSLSKKFSIGKQNLEFELGYEAYSGTTLFEEPFEMPYYKLSDITQESVSYKFLKNENYHDYYKVTAVYKVEMESVNTAQDKQTLSFEVNYIAFIDMVLEGITYDKEVKWEEAHDNLVLGFRPYVYRHRKFNNGMVVTDTIAGYNYGVVLSELAYSNNDGWENIYGPLLYRGNYEAVYDSNANVVATASLGVVGADVSRLATVGSSYDFAYDSADTKGSSDIYGNIFNEATAVNGRWYSSVVKLGTATACIDPAPDYDYNPTVKDHFGLDAALICYYDMCRWISVPFLWIDGQKIMFENNFKREVTTSISNLSTSRHKKAKLFKFDGVMHIYNRDFHYAFRDTIYEYEGVVPEEYQQYIKIYKVKSS